MVRRYNGVLQPGRGDKWTGRSVDAEQKPGRVQEHTDSLMAMSGVVGTAQGLCDGEPCIRVFVIKKSDQLMGQIPPQIEGYPVDVQETGEFRKLDPG